MKTGVLVGPAGTGKTTAGIQLARDHFRRAGVINPYDVGYFSFTRSAARVAASRIAEADLGRREMEEQYPFFRTLHSACYKALHADRKDVRVIGKADMKRFAERTGLEGSYAVSEWEDLAEVYQRLEKGGKTEWDACLTAYEVTRLRCRCKDGLEAARTSIAMEAFMRMSDSLRVDQYRAFVEKYEKFKADEGLVDFVDMLASALDGATPLPCRCVIIDEAQDLSPLLHAVVDRLASEADVVWWLGDDAQAIYSFAGASASDFIRRYRDADYRVMLRQTYRFGDRLVGFSSRILSRINERIDKTLIGVPGREAGIHLSGQFRPFYDDDCLILHRHVRGCWAIAQAFIDAGKPFRNERGVDPLGALARIKAFRTLDTLASGQGVPMGQARALIDELVPSIHHSEELGKVRFVVHGAKRKMVGLTGEKPFTLVRLMEDHVLTPTGAEMIKERRFSVFKHARDLEYYDRVQRNGHALDARCPVVTTIHGAKGGEARTVWVFSETGRKCWLDADSEHRLAYVASTRPQQELVVCVDRIVEWASAPYDYPIQNSA
jgi:superfamily I DNA/RNA helicase